MKTLIFGEIIWDVYPEEQVIGGAAYNFSAHLARLGDEAILISAVGNDEFGDRAIGMARHHGIVPDLIQRNSHATGACIVSLGGNGIPTYNVLKNTAYDHIAADSSLIDRIGAIRPDVFYFNTLVQRETDSRKSLEKILSEYSFKEIFCDINLRKDCFDRDSLSLCMEKAGIVKISEEEAPCLAELGLIPADGKDFLHRVAEKYPNLKLIAYTLGEKGSEVLDTRTDTVYSSGKLKKINVVSTVGAGDCYSAAFLHAYLSGKTVPEAIGMATERCYTVVSHREAVPF